MGRPIDADALKDHLQSLAYDDWNQGVSTSWADAYRECADMVDEQPTIEPEGYDSDEDKYDIIKCHCCKHIFTINSYHWTGIGFVKDDFKFCPNCGERLEEKSEKRRVKND